MKCVDDESRGQERWNQYGQQRIDDMRAHPDRYVLDEWPASHQQVCRDLPGELGSLAGKTILDMGSGMGQLSVLLARHGAAVTGVDVGADLVAASRLLARINDVACAFHQCSIVALPFPPQSFDAVVGTAILHHLSQADLCKALLEAHRLLKPGGVAIFHEPVENSKTFDLLQNLVPLGKPGTPGYRPSILQRRAWTAYMTTKDDRPLTIEELLRAGSHFTAVRFEACGLLIRLQRLLDQRYRSALTAIDHFILQVLPPVRSFSQTVQVEYRK